MMKRLENTDELKVRIFCMNISSVEVIIIPKQSLSYNKGCWKLHFPKFI